MNETIKCDENTKRHVSQQLITIYVKKNIPIIIAQFSSVRREFGRNRYYNSINKLMAIKVSNFQTDSQIREQICNFNTLEIVINFYKFDKKWKFHLHFHI